MPEWNQMFDFVFDNNKGTYRLEIKVKDKDNIADDVVGETMV